MYFRQKTYFFFIGCRIYKMKKLSIISNKLENYNKNIKIFLFNFGIFYKLLKYFK